MRISDWSSDVCSSDLALADILLTGKNTLRRTVTIKQGFQAKADYKEEFLAWLKAMPETDEWVAALADIRSAPSDGYSTEQLEVLNLLIRVLWLAAAQLNLDRKSTRLNSSH